MMIPISNEDTRVILQLLERGHAFYRNHAVKLQHVNDGRRMAVYAKILCKKLNKLNNYDKERISNPSGRGNRHHNSPGRRVCRGNDEGDE